MNASVSRVKTTRTSYSADRDYFKGLLRPAVVIVDMQQRFLDHIDNKVQARLLAEHLRLLGMCRDRNIPAAALEYNEKVFGPLIEPLRSALLRVPRHAIIEKSSDNGFFQSRLKSTLRGTFKSQTMLLAGVYAWGCVSDTANAGEERDFTVRTAPELIADRGRDGVCEEASRWYEQKGFFV